MTVGCIHHYGLGDAAVVVKGLYECKKFYACRLIVFCNALMKNLLRHCSFIDDLIDIHTLTKESADLIESYNCDYLLLSNPKASYIKDLAICRAKIITPLKLKSPFSSQCITPSIFSLFTYRRFSYVDRFYILVRIVDSKCYDKAKKAMIESSLYKEGYKIATSKTNEDKINAFLKQNLTQQTNLITINTFCVTSKYNLLNECMDRASN